MRPKRFTYTLIALDADGYLTTTEGTGAGPWATFLAQPGDGCSHPVTIGSAADLSGITFTITGTDAEDRTISETITGPNIATVTSVKYYATVTSLSASSTVGANTFTLGWTALAHTPIYPVDRFSTSPAVLAVDIGGAVTYSGQCTHGNVYELASDTLQFVNLIDMAALVADSSIGVAQHGATGLRVYVASHTSGTLALTYSQAK